MYRKFLLLFGCVMALVLFAPLTLQAAQTSRTLQPGRVYEFVGNDARVISNVTVPSGARYEFVETNARGEVTNFGFSSWRISVSGTGRTAVTPAAPMNVTFDGARLRVYERAGSALRQINLSEGQSVSLRNIRMSGLHIRTDQRAAYDFIVVDRTGEIVNSGVDMRFPQISVAGGSTATITARGSLTVYFPSVWYGTDLQTDVPESPAMVMREITSGRVYSLANLGSEAVTFNIDPFLVGVTFQYEFVTRGRDGHVISHGTAAGNQIQLAAHQTINITPLMDAEMFFPYMRRDSVSITYGAEASVYAALRPGMTIIVQNNDPIRSHTVLISCSTDARDFGFDYVMRHDDEISFGILENIIAARHTLNLPPGGEVIITAAAVDYALAVSVPEVPAVVALLGGETALVRRIIQPGESVFIENTGDIAAVLMADADENGASLDFVSHNMETGIVESFGRIEMREYLALGGGESAIITSPEHAVTLHFPRLFADITVEQTDERALYRRMLSHGDVVQIDNIDYRRYNRLFLVQDEAVHGEFGYDFLLSTFGGAVHDFGMSAAGGVIVPTSRRMTLMPQENAELSIAFPAYWYGRYLRVREADDAPLHRITIQPGRTITVRNSTTDVFALANNSQDTAAGFHIHGPGEFVQDARFGLRYVQRPPVDVNRDTPETGDIIVPANTYITITAALGEDLEIWMPLSWARRLSLAR